MAKKSKRRQKQDSNHQLLAGLVSANKKHQDHKTRLIIDTDIRKTVLKRNVPTENVGAAVVAVAVAAAYCDDSIHSAASTSVTCICEGGDEGTMVPDAFSSDMMTADDHVDCVTDDVATTKEVRSLWVHLFQRTKQKMKRAATTGTIIWTPTPIQLQSWPILLTRATTPDGIAVNDTTLNLIGIAPTGSGKTLAYGIPMVLRTISSNAANSITSGIDGLVLAPTRELAIQIGKELAVLIEVGGCYNSNDKNKSSTKVVTVYGGKEVDREEQIGHLSKCKKNGMLLVATPGRLVDLLENESRVKSWLSTVAIVTLDEADRLAIHTDMAEQVDTILESCCCSDTSGAATNTTICLFSATYPRKVKSKWHLWASMPRVCIKVNAVSVGGGAIEQAPITAGQKNGLARQAGAAMEISKIPPNVSQSVHFCEDSQKAKTLVTTLNSIRFKEGRQKGLCIVFFDRIKTLQRVHRRLLVTSSSTSTGNSGDGGETMKYQCAEFHGQLSQSTREQTLANFRCGKITTLLATDIAARGIHVNHVQWVINYDFPESLDQYVHRCGRAGRTKAADNNPSPRAVVHSFFTSESGARVAKDLLGLLRGCTDVHIDPHLLEFAAAGDDSAGTNAGDDDGIRVKKQKRSKPY